MWCLPGRGCRVKLVTKVGFGAMKLAGEGRERGSYASLLRTRRTRGWCGQVEESSGLEGRRGHSCVFWWYNAHGHEDHADRRRSRQKRVEGVGKVRNACLV